MANRDKAPTAPLVLIANDQEWSARSLESILGPNGYSVVRAYTGQQALERARTSQPDLIILDAQMPDMHGFEVCRTLRSDPRFSATTPIVITTSGPSGRTQRLEAYRAGAWEFLGQPLDGEALLLKLATFLQCKREVDCLREESLLDPGTGLYNMRGLARRAHEIGADAIPPARPARLRGVLAPRRRGRAPTRSPRGGSAAHGRPGGQCSSVRPAASSDAIGRLGQSEFAVIAPATGAEGAVRLVEPAGRGGRGLPDPGPGRRALASGSRPATARCPTSPSPRWTPWSSCSAPRPRSETSSGRATAERIRAFEQVPLPYPD